MTTFDEATGLPHRRPSAARRALVLGMALSLLAVLPAVPASADHTVVTDAEGQAFNYYTDVSLFGGPLMRRGYLQDELAAERGQPAPPESAASPAVDCPDGGGADTEQDADGARAVYGPATIFGGIWPDENNVAPPSGPLTSEIDCQLGEEGHVTASTSVTLSPGATRDEEGNWVDPTPTWTTPGGAEELWPGGVGPGPLVADEVHSSCTMTPDGVTSEVTFVNGIVETRYDQETQEPIESEPIPENPPPGYQVEGTIDHVGDSFTITFNVQTENPDGSFTVVAAHMELHGPTAVGDMVVGSSTCGPLTTEQPPHEPGAIAGVVTDAESGEPIAGATVTADGASATTGADGSYEIAGLAPGEYDVTADADGYVSDTQTATVAEGAQTTVDFALSPEGAEPDGGAIAGTVTDQRSGEGISDAHVTVRDGSGALVGEDTTDEDGSYEVDGLDDGTYTVTVMARSYRPQSREVVVADGATTTADFELRHGLGPPPRRPSPPPPPPPGPPPHAPPPSLGPGAGPPRAH